MPTFCKNLNVEILNDKIKSLDEKAKNSLKDGKKNIPEWAKNAQNATKNAQIAEQAPNAQGGKPKKPSPKRTTKKVKIGSVERNVHVGPRGGEYVKLNGQFVPLKTALKRS
jgi:hypothetical protein